MFIRSIRLLTQPLIRSHIKVKALQPSRNSAWVYRRLPDDSPRWTFFVADGLNTFMWWWIFVHCYYQWGHIVGEYTYPQPKKWTDAELGVVDVEVD